MLFNCQHIILGSLARVGDRVIMNGDERGESWGYKSADERARQGQRGTVVGFEDVFMHIGRFNEFGRPAGIFRTNGVPMVKWDVDGVVMGGDLHSLSWWPWEQGQEATGDVVALVLEIGRHNDAMNKARQSERPKSSREEWDKAHVKVGDLPDFPLYELDVVRDGDGESFVVEDINWRAIGDKCSDGSAFPVVSVKSIEQGYRTSYRPDELTLVEEGNVRRWFTGRRESLVFCGEEDEVRFYDGLGLVESVKTFEATPGVPPKEALQAIANGTADAMRMFNVPLSGTRKIELIRMRDRSVGDRLRDRSMRGFGLTQMA